MRSIFFMITLFIFANATAQIKITGTVTDESGAALPGVNVVLTNHGGGMLSYSLSDSKGFYLLEYKGQSDSIVITLSGLDYKKIVKKLPAITQSLSFVMQQSPLLLKEAIVHSEAISQKGDTINYMVSTFANKNDKVIGDVIKKLPGIEVESSGEISYNGKAINKFYVENLDLLQGRYGIATKNISANDVASVQVYENHQPIKALENKEISDQAAINIRLKNSAKGTLSATAALGAGADPFLWNNELVAMYFAKKHQNISAYKGNNTGNNVSTEFKSFYNDNNGELYQNRLLSVLTQSPPPIEQNRYLFNSIHSVSTNNIFVVKSDINMNVNLNYYNDIQKGDSYQSASYYISEDSVLNISEFSDSEKKISELNSDIKVTVNREKYYLDNLFKIKVQAEKMFGTSVTDEPNEQNSNNNHYGISNAFTLVNVNNKEKTIQLDSYNAYNRTPQSLLVTTNLYDSLFNKKQGENQINQDIETEMFLSKTAYSFSFSKGKIRHKYLAGIDLENKSLKSELNPISSGNKSNFDDLLNNLNLFSVKPFISTGFGYSGSKLFMDIKLVLSYNSMFVSDRIPKNNASLNKWLINPMLHVMYDLNDNWRVSARYSLYNYFGGINSLYSGYIMKTYRNLNRYDGRIGEYSDNMYSLSLSYKNTRKSLFGNLSATYIRSKANLLYDRTFSGILQINNIVFTNSSANRYSFSGNISKSIYTIRTTISLGGNYNNINSSQIIQHQIVGYSNSAYGLHPSIESSISSWVSLSYYIKWSVNRSKIDNSNFNYPAFSTISHKATASLFPFDGFIVNLMYENYYNSTQSSNKSFSDIEFRYKFKPVELSCRLSNIFNENEYTTSNYTDIGSFVNMHRIRPRQVLFTAKFKLF